MNNQMRAIGIIAGSTIMLGAPVRAQCIQLFVPSAQAAIAECGSSIADNVVNDRELIQRVQMALAKDTSVATLNLRIKATNGHVELSGVASSQAHADRAMVIAFHVAGVKSVKSNIRIS